MSQSGRVHLDSPHPARVLAVDLGRRRIGLAVSDPLGVTVQGLDTLTRRNLRDDIARVAAAARDRKVTRIVVGLPLHMSGEESPMAREARLFAGKLREATGLDVDLHDERLTSVEAESILAGRGWSLDRLLKEKRRGAVDRLAATLILEDWLSARRGTQEAG
jgi:putative Holliday junction resolvase